MTNGGPGDEDYDTACDEAYLAVAAVLEELQAHLWDHMDGDHGLD